MIDILTYLKKVKPSGNGRFMACCPAHEDKTPSLAIQKLDDGRILLNCFAGCGAADVVAALGLSLTDLFPDGAINQRLMGWGQMVSKNETAKVDREEAKTSNARLYLSVCDAKRSKGGKLTVAELEQERVCYMRVNG